MTLLEYINGILSANRTILGKAITLIESTRETDQALADKIIQEIMPHTGKSKRIGVSGIPGVGKSTFIEALGSSLVRKGKKIAVLAIDPSSRISKGSILGDKTRMENLSQSENVFIRPSPTAETLGGVAGKTRETLLICEAAGYEYIFIETVGVGQSEIAVHSMVDLFLLLMITGAGDELQGIKRGIMEMADVIIINKAEKANLEKAAIAKNEIENAIHLFPAHAYDWKIPVNLVSSTENTGLEEIESLIEAYFKVLSQEDRLEKKRNEQAINWMQSALKEELLRTLLKNDQAQEEIKTMEERVKKGEMSPFTAARILVKKLI